MENGTFNSDGDEWVTKKMYYAVSGVIFFLMSALNLPVILIIIVGIYNGKVVRNMHILSLSISDFAVGISYVPAPNLLCYHRLSLYLICLSASSIHIVLICFDRVWVIFRNRPVYNGRQAKIRFVIIVVTTWILAFVSFFIPIRLSKVKDLEPNYCAISTVFQKDGEFIGMSIAIHFTSYIFLVLISNVWAIVLLIVRRRRLIFAEVPRSEIPSVSRITDDLNVQTSSFSCRRGNGQLNTMNEIDNDYNGGIPKNTKVRTSVHSKGVRTISVIASAYTICTLPILCIVYTDLLQARSMSLNARRVTSLVSGFNSIFNPIIYAFMIKEIKQNISFCKDMIKGLFC